MKLLYITNGITGSGGLERVLSIKASMLAEEYHYDVSIMTLNEPLAPPFYEFSPKVKILPIQFTKSTALNYIVNYRKEIQKLVNQCKPDIICVCDDGLKGFLLPKLIETRSKWVYERHVSKLILANDSDRRLKKVKNKLQWKLMDKFSNRFDRFIVLTEKNRLEWNHLTNIEVIPNPLPFTTTRRSNLAKRKVICVGRISYHKGQDILIKLWSNIHRRFPEWELHLYGKEDLNFLDTTKLIDNVFFHPPEKNISKAYLDSSIYVMPSRFEGFGMVLIEAMAFGLPCVSFDCNYGPSDIISDGIDGFLVNNGNNDLFQQKIEALIRDAELRKTMGDNAIKNVERFTAKNIVAKWDNLFRDLMT